MKPSETYKADLSIDLKKHHAPLTFLDKLAFWTVKAMRYPTDIFFQVRPRVPVDLGLDRDVIRQTLAHVAGGRLVLRLILKPYGIGKLYYRRIYAYTRPRHVEIY